MGISSLHKRMIGLFSTFEMALNGTRSGFLEVVLPTVLSLQSDCASAGTQTLLFLWCMENFWRRALVEPVCIASKPSNSSSSYFSCCPPIPIPSPLLPPLPFPLTSPALACKTHGRNLPDIVGGTFGHRCCTCLCLRLSISMFSACSPR